MDTFEFPKAMSIKKADLWLTAHPEVKGWDRVAFWHDQSTKHLKKSGRWLIVAGCLVTLSALLQVVSLIAKSVGQ